MRKVLFILSQSLYAKVLIPLAAHCVKQGYQVAFAVNRPVVFRRSWGFSARYIRNNPTTVGIVSPEALRFVAQIIGYSQDWDSVEGAITYERRPDPSQFDAVIGTTKNLDLLHSIQAQHNIQTYAMGYQHMPFVVKVGGKFNAHAVQKPDTVFIGENPFSASHDFSNLLHNSDWKLTSFLHLGRVHQRQSSGAHAAAQKNDTVLIFHPGGYRDIVTALGASKAVSYSQQKELIEQICLPLIEVGLKPVLKIHPLRARFHDLADVQKIIRQIEIERKLPRESIQSIGPEAWYWPYALRSRFVLTFGSSSIYELWTVGLSNVFVSSFLGDASRTKKFEFFDSIYLNSKDEYLAMVNGGYRDRELDALAAQVFDSFRDLFRGDVVERVFSWIENELKVES